MTNYWPPGTMKIHEQCGGLVRWVEAVKNPSVGYTGHCLRCDVEGICVENMIPIQTYGGEEPHRIVNSTDVDTLASLEWEHHADWDTNQKRLRDKVVE